MNDNMIDRLISDYELKQKQITIDLHQNDKRLENTTDMDEYGTLDIEGCILREQLRMTQEFLDKLYVYKQSYNQ